MRTTRLIVLAVVAVLAAGCGGGIDRLTTRATAPPPSANPAHLAEGDSGRTIHVHVGEEVDVELPGGSSGGYHQPVSSSEVMRRTSASGGYPTGVPARASFSAARVGTADLTSYDDFSCLHSEPRCLPPQREWIVHVIVQ